MAFLRAREVKGIIKERGETAGTIWCLEVLAEQQIALQKDIRELATMMDQLTSIVGQFTSVAENMKNAVETLNSRRLYDDDMPKNTQDLS